MTKTRVLVVNNAIGTGGIESSLIQFLKYAASIGDWTVDLILWRPDGSHRDQIPANINIVSSQDLERLRRRTQDWRPTETDATPKAGALIATLGRLIRYTALKVMGNPFILTSGGAGHYDVAISYSQGGLSPLYVANKADASRKVLWYHHGSYMARGRQFKRDARTFAAFDHIVAVAESTRDLLSEKFPHLSERLTVIPNMIDIETVKLKAQDLSITVDIRTAGSDVMKIATVARLSRDKGIDLLVNTGKVLQQRNVHFEWHVVGDGPLREEVAASIKAAGLDRQILLTGNMKNPFPIVQRADIYVQPSRVEAHSMTLLEAIALQKPIVASDIPSIREELHQGELGILAKREPEAFADSLIALWEDAPLRDSLSRRLALHDAATSDTELLIRELIDGDAS